MCFRNNDFDLLFNWVTYFRNPETTASVQYELKIQPDYLSFGAKNNCWTLDEKSVLWWSYICY